MIAQTIVAEVGLDMSKWPTEALASWVVFLRLASSALCNGGAENSAR